MKRVYMLSVVVVAVALISFAPLASAGHGDRNRAPSTWVRAIHLSPDAPAVDIRANNNVLFKDLSFEEKSRYKRVKAGEYNIQVVPTGATEPVVIDADLDLTKWRKYSVLAVNTLDNIEPIVIEDKFRYTKGKESRVRFVHASPDAPAVDIALQDGDVLFSDVEFKEVENYLKVKRGKYDLEVRLAGTQTVVLEVDNLRLRGGQAYTIFATGEVGEGTLNAVALKDNVWGRW